MSKSEWGNAVWYLMHTLAFKLNKEYENEVPVLFDYFYRICCNLPCPSCSEHARKNLSRLRRDKIKTKEDLIHVLWEFHNMVNKQTKKNEFSKENHDLLYKDKNVSQVLYTFFAIMSKKTGNERGLIYTWTRSLVLKDFHKYIISKKNMFL